MSQPYCPYMPAQLVPARGRASVLALVLVTAVGACGQQEEAPPTPVVEPKASATAPTAAPIGYACESGKTVMAQYPDTSTARVTYQGQVYDLRLAPSASGARYLGASVEWWTVSGQGQEGATLSRLGPNQDVGVAVLERCSRPSAAGMALPAPGVSGTPTAGAMTVPGVAVTSSSAPPCRGPQLKLSAEGGDAGAGNRVLTVGVQNLGAQACSLTGYPSVTLQDAQSRNLTTVRSEQGAGQSSSTAVGPVPVTLASQAKAFFDIGWTVVPDTTLQRTCPTVAQLRMVAPGDTAAVPLAQAFTPCGGRIRVGAFRAVALPTPAA